MYILSFKLAYIYIYIYIHIYIHTLEILLRSGYAVSATFRTGTGRRSLPISPARLETDSEVHPLGTMPGS